MLSSERKLCRVYVVPFLSKITLTQHKISIHEQVRVEVMKMFEVYKTGKPIPTLPKPTSTSTTKPPSQPIGNGRPARWADAVFGNQLMDMSGRRLKPSNLLVKSNCDLAICDFGLARGVPEKGAEMTDYVQTRWYRAPELLCDNQLYDKKVDVWGTD